MTLHSPESKTEVGVRELHDRLSEYLERVEGGKEVLVTKRGKPIARLIGIGGEEPLAELERRGLVNRPTRPRTPHTPRIKASGSVSDLVREQRR
jgi:prevent-host-death family protein